MQADIFSIVAPVLICAAIGYAWARLGRPYDVSLITLLISNVGAPCLVFHSLTNLTVSISEVSTMMLVSLLAIAGCAVIGGVGLRLSGLRVRTYLPAVIFPNTGNMGLPLCVLAFGEHGLGLAVGVFAVHSVAMFTVGATLTSGNMSWRALARMPLLYSVTLALTVAFFDARPPVWINNTTKLLGEMTIPLMLVTLGVSLARLRVQRFGPSIGVALVRLCLGFVLGIGLAYALGLQDVARGVLIIQLSMPVAVFTYLFAQQYNEAPEEIAGAVFISTVLSFIMLPTLLLWVIRAGPN